MESTFLRLTETLISKTEPSAYGSAVSYVGPSEGGENKTLLFQQK